MPSNHKKEERPSILIVDDERGTREALAKFLRPSYEVTIAEDGEIGLNLLARNHYDLVLSDIRMPGANGLTILDAALKKTPPPPCILFTAYGSIEAAVDAMKRGAFDFVTKPVNLDQLEILIERAFESGRIKEENAELKKRLDSKFGLENIIGSSAVIQKIIENVRQVAPTRATISITGESGTGKELIAQAIHQFSRRPGRFVAVHCAALPETLLESELFGHEKGSFTGANEQRKGRFELADGGTLFLDEIGEIPLSTQVKLLRVLETRTFERIGGMETLQVDTRVVTATNRDLAAMVAEGAFREDLFYRLDVVSIHIPPLRERQEDIPPLVNHFLAFFAKENGRPPLTISESAMSALCSYSWPGNIRELKNCVERMVVLTRGQIIELDNVPIHIREKITPGITKTILGTSSCDLERNEKILIARALEECKGNRTKAAEKLGISRRTLHRKLAAYGIE
ncbi:MAG: Transcriptional regulatory protein ZraR [Lentisphaerae bacterium ADurb.Bin242]|nr:MAG: Transcriptional regulatory protein ZraR [Lentisphaerae bacterium ADurb.Bin242]